MNVVASIGLSILLLLANAFFVAAEFAVVSAKRHRLEVAAPSAAVRRGPPSQQSRALAGPGRRPARDHPRTLGLGALAKPAVADLLDPVLQLTSLPDAAATSSPSCWPWRSSSSCTWSSARWPRSRGPSPTPSGRPSCWRYRSGRSRRPPAGCWRSSTPLANALLRIWNVEPVEGRVSVQGPAELRLLLDSSREHGLLAGGGRAAAHQRPRPGRRLPVYAGTLPPFPDVVAVPSRRARVRRGTAPLGRADGPGWSSSTPPDAPPGLVHVRDAVVRRSPTPR